MASRDTGKEAERSTDESRRSKDAAETAIDRSKTDRTWESVLPDRKPGRTKHADAALSALEQRGLNLATAWRVRSADARRAS